MAQSDGAAVDVYFFTIEAEFFFHREILRGKGFIHFDEVDVIESKPGFLQSNFGRRHGAAAHHFRIDPGNAPAHDPSQRTYAALARLVERHNDHRGRAI